MFWSIVIISLITIATITIANIGGRNLIVLMLAVELIFFTFSLACIVYFYEHPGLHWNLDLLFAALGITVLAAAESALALAITSRMHKQTRSIKIKKFF